MLRAAIDAVDGGRLVQHALDDPDVARSLQRSRAIDVIAAGKAAGVMVNAFATSAPVSASPDRDASHSTVLRSIVAIGPARPDVLADGAEWFTAGHPLPTEGSLNGARRALDLAARSANDDLLVVLLSGGGSALMALPAEGITLADKQQTARTLMEQGADIHELNTVRKHLSAIKGGQLAAAARGSVLTLAISDVVGDDLSVIASGPTVPDDSTFAAALAVLASRGGASLYPEPVVARLQRGVDGVVAETPKPGDPRLSRTAAHVIGRQRGAIEGARAAAEGLGYRVHIIAEPVTGEARTAGVEHVRRIAREVGTAPSPVCVLSSGETTVTVRGTGKGGRNQEFAFAMAQALDLLGSHVAAASIGTDGVDGPTDAAGAIVDASTFDRAHADGIAHPERYLDNNDTYTFFDRLADLVKTGPTNTNVGDIQIVLIGG